jgi:hypothetical protein
MPKVFFAFPYDYDRSHPQFRVAFREAAEACGHEAVFADEVYRSREILQHITECIDECYAAFFDITGLNPNVLIELGIGYASQKHVFVLHNTDLHVQELDSFWGHRTIPLDIPADLRGLIRLTYVNSGDLRLKVVGALRQNPAEPAGMAVATSIKDRLKKFGPLNMSGIASGIDVHIDRVRPVLKELVAARQVERLGSGRGTKYRAIN